VSGNRADVPVEELRNAVRERVAEKSIRVVAQETGMSPTGLWRFIGGTSPYLKTQRRLQAWYVMDRAERSELEVTGPLAAAALDILTRHLPAEMRMERAAQLLSLLEEQGKPVPAWLARLREHGDVP